MHPSVTAVLVCRNGGERLHHTLAAIAAQTHRVDALVAIDFGSTDGSLAVLGSAGAVRVVEAGRLQLTPAIAKGLDALGPTDAAEWLWVLTHDNAPAPDALQALVAAVEVAPSVAVAGPKLVRTDDPATIARYGQTMTRFGATVQLVDEELDQAQYDHLSDVLAVQGAGMLVRREAWAALGGFDPALPSIDAALDFGVRARLAGYRVITVPRARVETSGGPETFESGAVSATRRAAIARRAQLHRRLAYAPGWAVPLHWLSILPIAIARSAWHLLTKRPGAVGAEVSSLRALGGVGAVNAARRRIRRTRKAGWAALAPLRATRRDVRDRRAQARESAALLLGTTDPLRPRLPFGAGGGAAVTLLLLVLGALLSLPFAGASALSGGATEPLGATVSSLWSQVGWSGRITGDGAAGPADPFTVVLALLGSIAFWHPSSAIVGLWLVAPALAGLGAWRAAAEIAPRRGPAVVAAVAWAAAPPLLLALADGRVAAVVAHLALPWLVLLASRAPRSWAAGAGASLVAALVAVAAPSVVPALLVAWVVWMAVNPRRVHRLFGLVLPTAALAAPLVVSQVLRGSPLGLVADPGVPTAAADLPAWRLALGALDTTGWASLLTGSGLDDVPAWVVPAVLVLPIVALAVVALVRRARAVAVLGLGVLGLATAVAAQQVSVVTVAGEPVPVWSGAGVSLWWAALVALVVVALGGWRRGTAVWGSIAAAGAVLAVLPIAVGGWSGTWAVRGASDVELPAFVAAEAGSDPQVGTLVVRAVAPGTLAIELERGTGTTLERRSTFVDTAPEPDATAQQLAELTGVLATGTGDPSAALGELGVDFVLLAPDGDADAATDVASALDASPLFTGVGETEAGQLWRYRDASASSLDAPEGPLDTAVGVLVLSVQAVVLGSALLLAVPTVRRRRRTDHGADESLDDAFAEETDG